MSRIPLALLSPLPLLAGCVLWEMMTGQYCVAPGTPIATPEGPRPVETLGAGDEVWCLAPDGRRVPGRVVAVRSGPAERTLRLVLSTGATLVLTPGHPVATGNRFLPAGDLAPGDTVETGGGPAAVLWIEPLGPAPVVYDLTVSPHPNFLAAGVLVHNKSYSPPGPTDELIGTWYGHDADGRAWSLDFQPDRGSRGFLDGRPLDVEFVWSDAPRPPIRFETTGNGGAGEVYLTSARVENDHLVLESVGALPLPGGTIRLEARREE